MELPEANICHRTSERIRVKISSKKGEAHYFDAVVKTLSKSPGILRIEANPLTGSVLIVLQEKEFDLRGLARAKKLFALKDSPWRAKPFYEAFSQSIQQCNLQMKDFTGGGLDLTGLAFLVLITIGIFQLMEGNVMVPAITAFWYATSLIMEARLQPSVAV